MKKYFSLFLAGIPLVLCNYRVERKSGESPQQGNCIDLKIDGTSEDHWYACCNNCDMGSSNTCDKTTYHTGSSVTYCGSCGLDNGAESGYKNEEFGCGGCIGQTRTKNTCTFGLSSLSGKCWAFVECFKSFCKKRARVSRSTNSQSVPDTCFNLKCEAGETVNNCPADCCQNKNEKCKWKNGECVDECCGAATCCGDESKDADSSDANSIVGHKTKMILLSALIFVRVLQYSGNFL